MAAQRAVGRCKAVCGFCLITFQSPDRTETIKSGRALPLQSNALMDA
ncbi:MAG: hypothetical protein PUH16_00875 [Clostridiales bacterium]|nr:hypothetical protein [Clostridiales bacterium]MDY2721798.1 hypothetical protein [Eubacteriales bacterium]